jgi:rhodanese-related sulfurtransferase
VPSASVHEVSDDAFLLDVREDDEWTAGHIPGAVHMPMMEIPARSGEIPHDRDVVVVCRVGSRSAQVVAYLRQNGWDRVINLDGGMSAWGAAGRPMMSEDGGAAHVA